MFQTIVFSFIVSVLFSLNAFRLLCHVKIISTDVKCFHEGKFTCYGMGNNIYTHVCNMTTAPCIDLCLVYLFFTVTVNDPNSPRFLK